MGFWKGEELLQALLLEKISKVRLQAPAHGGGTLEDHGGGKDQQHHKTALGNPIGHLNLLTNFCQEVPEQTSVLTIPIISKHIV